LFVLVRSTVLSYAVLLLLVPFYGREDGSYNFGHLATFGFALIFALFEEQGRWLYSSVVVNQAAACIKFCVYIVSFETIMFYYLNADRDWLSYATVRAPSMLIHVINSAICWASWRHYAGLTGLLFLGAVLLHSLFNAFADDLWMLLAAR